jgi:hypothetical protein
MSQQFLYEDTGAQLPGKWDVAAESASKTNGDAGTTLKFRNYSPQTVKVFWHDQDGNE